MDTYRNKWKSYIDKLLFTHIHFKWYKTQLQVKLDLEEIFLDVKIYNWIDKDFLFKHIFRKFEKKK